MDWSCAAKILENHNSDAQANIGNRFILSWALLVVGYCGGGPRTAYLRYNPFLLVVASHEVQIYLSNLLSRVVVG